MFIKLYLIQVYNLFESSQSYKFIYFHAGSTSNLQHPTISINLQRLIGSCNNIVIDECFLDNMDSSKIEELGPLMHDHTTRNKEKKILENYLEGILVIAQA